MTSRGRIITCPECGKENVRHAGHGLCKTCYGRKQRQSLPEGQCSQCERTRKLHSDGICNACKVRNWQLNHPEYKKIHAEREKKWRTEHPEESRAREAKRSKTPKRIAWHAKYSREYYDQHRKEICEYQSRWRREHLKEGAHYKRRRRARVLGLPDTLTLEEWDAILEQYNHSCAYCQAADIELVKDHLVPASKGGGFTAENIVPACTSCNCSKSDMDVVDFIFSGRVWNPHPLILERFSIFRGKLYSDQER